MTFPSYQWICHRCKTSNVAGRSSCAACEAPAVASAESLGLAPPRVNGPSQGDDERIWWHLPEALCVLFLLLSAPIWAVRMVAAGKVLLAVGWLAGTIGIIYVGIQCLARRQTGFAYACVLGLFALAWWIEPWGTG